MAAKGDNARRLARNDPVVGKNVRRYRIARGLSQTDLGKICGITFQQIQKYEKGTNAVPPGRLRLICESLQVSIEEIYKGAPKINGKALPEMTHPDMRIMEALIRIPDGELKKRLGRLIFNLAGVREDDR
jgi:transcriptional regulator with XRE-family HTH domain